MTRKNAPPKFEKVKWHELFVVRAGILAILIAATGYAISLVLAIQGITSITNMAFDPKIEQQMDQHLTVIKKAHKYRQETFVARLSRLMPPIYRRGEAPVMKPMIEKWLEEAGITAFIPKESITIEKMGPKELKELPRKAITWIDSATIKIRNFKVSLPKKKIREEYQKAEELILKHRAIRANWKQEIQPTLITLQVIVVLSTGILLIGGLLILFRMLKRNIDKIVDGFSLWSEKDPSFRFNENLAGEGKYLALRFNHMAGEVEANRNRLVYLEKVASWQIIARKLAHEIKNPLTPIQMMVSQLVRRYQGDDEDFKSLLEDAKNIISEEVMGLRRMVDNFSKFAQMPQPKLEPMDLVELVRRVAELEKAGFPDHNIIFKAGLEAAYAKVDPQLIRQVLINIIKNAAEAASDGDSEIIVYLEDHSKTYDIVVKDNGPGIPKENLPRIFEAYFTTKHSGPSPGMGLGLAVCQKVMLEHGGDLRVESEKNDTRFYMTLPKTRQIEA